MKCISMTQPWASLVILGLKRYETRSWKSDYEGPLAIHAAKNMPGPARWLAEQLGKRGILAPPELLPLGGILGVVHKARCIPTSLLRRQVTLTPDEREYGNFDPGRYAWPFSEAQALPAMIPCAGHLALWDVPPEVAAQLAACFPDLSQERGTRH